MFDYTPYAGLPETADEAKKQCVLANRILANEHVLDGYGHVSVRNPETGNTFFQARVVAPEFVTYDDMLEVDLQANIVTKTDFRAYGERVIHAAVLKARQDVFAVFHGHPHEVVAFSTTGMPFRSLGQFCGMFWNPLPVFDAYRSGSGMLLSTPEDGAELARALGDAYGIVMRGHGFTMTGNSVQQMVMNSIFLRDNTKMQLMLLPAPSAEIRYLSEEEGRGTEKTQYSDISLGRCWKYWVARAKKAMPDLGDF
ncbi:MAG: class II aldolase/adducin family protein [Clostridiales Family XIII bacterium]|jgi:ribulose-5-phosphate 4-epimerase/fuculose-1-phosphate aldolase|nr:class II aldolase/adducin family protein [Clostridiales Family XIII bacterium]